MTLIPVTPPTVEPLTAAEAKARLGIGSEMSDAVMSALISAARQKIDGANGWLGRAINTQTWDLVLDRFEGINPPRERGFYPEDYWSANYYAQNVFGYPDCRAGIPIPLPPLQSITSVKYFDVDAVQQTLDPATYKVLPGEPSRIVLASGASWPATSYVPGAVTIRFVAGYGDAGSNVPETIRTAIAIEANMLQNLMSQAAFLRSETADGVGAISYANGAQGGLSDAVMGLLQNLRVWMA